MKTAKNKLHKYGGIYDHEKCTCAGSIKMMPYSAGNLVICQNCKGEVTKQRASKFRRDNPSLFSSNDKYEGL